MSEQKTHDDGPGETPLETLLREALNARADQISPHDLRPEAPPAHRVRRIRPLYTVVLPVVALAAAASIGYLGFQASPVAKQETPAPAASISTSPTPAPSLTTASPSASTSPSAQVSAVDPAGQPSPGAATSSSAPAGTPYTFKGVNFVVPAGWTTKAIDSENLCLLSPGAKGNASCEPYGVTVTAYSTPGEVAAATWPTVSDSRFRVGWGHQSYCYSWANPHGSDTPTTQQYSFQVATLAQQAVDTATWQVKCASGDTFTARRWDFPKQQVFISARGLSADYEAGLQSLLGSLDVSGHPDPLAGTAQKAVTVSLQGLTAGQKVYSDNSTIPFSVTWTNNSTTSFASIMPLAYTDYYDGIPNDQVGIAQGTLERQDGSTWTKIGALSIGGGTDYWTAGAPVAFPLAPGAHRTINYRMTLDPVDNTGTLDLVGLAALPHTKPSDPYTSVGIGDLPLVVTKR